MYAAKEHWSIRDEETMELEIRQTQIDSNSSIGS
jgi:hypothetical protein